MMPTVLSHASSSVQDAVREALEMGQTLIFPTDTVYGIGGNPWDRRCLERVRAIKQRPPDQPFTLHMPTCSSLERYVKLDECLRKMIRRLLPGPYTLLLPAAAGAPASAVLDGKIGIRVPDHPFFASTLTSLDRPIFGTSVNRRGQPPLGDIDAIIDRFASVDLIITGPVGAGPSAILDATVRPSRLVRGDPLPGPLQDLLR